MFRNWIFCAFAFGIALAASSANATLFYADYFNYPDGNLVNGTNGPNMPNPPFWQGKFSSISGQPSGRATISNGMLQIFGNFVTPSVERPYLPTGSTLAQGQTWYAGFNLFLPRLDVTLGAPHFTVGEFYADGGAGAGMFISASPSAPVPLDYIVGLGVPSPSPDIEWPTHLAFDTWHRIVMSYTLNPDNNSSTRDSISTLWIDPVDASSPSLTSTNQIDTAFTAFYFDHGAGTFVDNLFVATTFAEAVPEPAGFAMAAVAGIAFVAASLHRRRQAVFQMNHRRAACRLLLVGVG
jgi:hypothetical protein